jgi:hypothetical protein
MENLMRTTAAFLALAACLPLCAVAQSTGSAQTAPTASAAERAHRSDDIARHRQMARAHEDAARCLESGAPERQCQEKLREACKGIAVGQYCGMRHGH